MIINDRLIAKELEWLTGRACEALHTHPGLVHYAYHIRDVIGEVRKQTTYIGSSRVTSEGLSLIDKIAYSADETDLDRTFTRDAMAQTFVPLQGFTRGLGDAYHYDEGFREHIVVRDHAHKATTAYKFDSGDNSVTIELTSDKPISDDEYVMVTVDVHYKVRDLFGEICLKEIGLMPTLTPSNLVATTEGKYKYSVTLHPQYEVDSEDRGLGAEKLLSVNVENVKAHWMWKRVRRVFKGDWLVIVEKEGDITGRLYMCTQDGAHTDEDPELSRHFKPMPFDFRHTIHYILFFEDVFSYSVLKAVDTHIFNALVEYVIYRWFSLVYPQEASVYWEKFQSRLAQIKDLLDKSSTKIVRRPYMYLG